MAASTQLSLRSSHRVAGRHPPTDGAATEPKANIAKATLAQRAKRERSAADPSPDGRTVKRAKVERRAPGQLEPRSRPGPREAAVALRGGSGARTSKSAPTKSLPLRAINGAHKATRRPPRDALRPANAPASTKDRVKQLTIETAHVPGERRSLRSQGGASRFKSDLSLFFPCYDEMISNEPRTPGESGQGAGVGAGWLMKLEFLTPETPLVVVDEQTRARPSTPVKHATPTSRRRSAHVNGVESSPIPVGSPFAPKGTRYPKLYNTQKLDFSSIERGASHAPGDPLDDAYYLKCHRKAERREKQLRNIEKNKAQHEKDNLERILEGLRGPDWLKVMGISGITESEKKDYEHKRDYFVKEVAALIKKFKAWKEEEKRRKWERDHVVLAGEEAAEQDEVEEEEEEAEADEEMEADEAEEEEEEEDEDVDDAEELDEVEDGEEGVDAESAGQVDEHGGFMGGEDGLSDGDPPDYNDVDAWAARQLRQEAFSATSAYVASTWVAAAASPPSEKVEAAPLEPFTSFYKKPHLRMAAVGNHRRSGRSATAFGRPLPEMVERYFELPDDILTPEAQIASARTKRRLKRESKDGAGHALK
ncbi:MAG: hypothetical protein M1838_004950 [Thelocarpon superellum]|nr:MAG: hypothetical protein M1838_004950 [Thelocarpon superellum]